MTYDRNGALRVSLWMDSFTLPAWAYEVLATLQQSAYARIQLIVLNDSFAPRRRGVLSKVVKKRIRSYHLDVLVRLGFRILRGGILQAARYGVWSYHHGDNKVNRGGPPGFWEVLEGHAVTGSILQRLNDELDNGTVLCRSFSATDPLSGLRGSCRPGTGAGLIRTSSIPLSSSGRGITT